MKVSTGRDICSAISATLAEESTPPERKTPKGTSAIIRFLIDSRSSRRISAWYSSSRTRRAPFEELRRERVPVANRLDLPPAAADEHVPGGEFADATEERARRGRGQEGEVVVERFLVQLGRHRRVGEDGFDLRGEEEAAALVPEVERLDADAVAREHESFAPLVPECDGEVALYLFDEVEAALLVEVDDGLAVGARVVDVAALLKTFAQLGMVVNLAVEDEPHARPVAAAHRLMAGGREVDDREAAEAETQTAAVEEFRAHVVRPAVRHPVAHLLDYAKLDAPLRRPVLPDSADAAHKSQEAEARP